MSNRHSGHSGSSSQHQRRDRPDGPIVVLQRHQARVQNQQPRSSQNPTQYNSTYQGYGQPASFDGPPMYDPQAFQPPVIGSGSSMNYQPVDSLGNYAYPTPGSSVEPPPYQYWDAYGNLIQYPPAMPAAPAAGATGAAFSSYYEQQPSPYQYYPPDTMPDESTPGRSFPAPDRPPAPDMWTPTADEQREIDERNQRLAQGSISGDAGYGAARAFDEEDDKTFYPHSK
ncbi:hypothetical protein F5B20DRAFT_565147 [Whalleya microplaca]|nr:hypothetical protein F5B20DRAFT_565147 [Whalleya microplaca]